MVLKLNITFKEFKNINWSKMQSTYVLFGILMDSSVLHYRVKTLSPEDQTVEYSEFSVKNKLA